MEAFRDEGLEVGEVRTVTRFEDRSPIPETYEEKMSFTTPFVERSSGLVFKFPSRGPLAPVREYCEEVGDLCASYVYVEANLLTQTDGDVPEDPADGTAKFCETREDRAVCEPEI